MPDRVKGRFCWYDLMTTDPGAATKFYSKVVGWGTMKWEGPADYTMWMNGEAPFGGVNELPEEARKAGAPPHWLAYVATPDVDATVKQAEKLGARVQVPPTDIPTVGRFAVLADPQGAVFAAFTAEADTPGHDGPPNPGEFSWHELATTDPDGAFRFYSDLFSWNKTGDFDMGPMGVYQMYGRGELPLGGMFSKPDEMPVSAWLFYAMVDDVDEGAKRVTANGGQIANGPMEVPGGDRIVQCIDPQGAMFALHSRAKG
ncbi:MAG: VOC family protein [Gemmatimonadetes bacterium]|nr:VOC family protein [Gemmatimonadota bacterium]